MTALADLGYRIGLKLEQIEALLPPEYKLTLIARHTMIDPAKNADIIMTKDDLAAAVAAIGRHPSMVHRPAEPPMVRAVQEVSQ